MVGVRAKRGISHVAIIMVLLLLWLSKNERHKYLITSNNNWHKKDVIDKNNK